MPTAPAEMIGLASRLALFSTAATSVVVAALGKSTDFTGILALITIIGFIATVVTWLWKGGGKFASLEVSARQSSEDIGSLQSIVKELAVNINSLTVAISAETRDAQHWDARFRQVEEGHLKLAGRLAVVEDHDQHGRERFKEVVDQFTGEIHTLREWRHALENDAQAMVIRQEILLRRATREAAAQEAAAQDQPVKS